MRVNRCVSAISGGGASIGVLPLQLQSLGGCRRPTRFVRLALRVFIQNDEDCVDVIQLIQFLNYCALFRIPDDGKDEKTSRAKPLKVVLGVLYCTVSQPSVTATHTCTQRTNFYIILGHYSQRGHLCILNLGQHSTLQNYAAYVKCNLRMLADVRDVIFCVILYMGRNSHSLT